jgi:sodium transport system ATP-binding protein
MITFSALSKHYGPLVAVRELTFEVRPGEVYALLGPNGAGKTTALRCLATLLKPTSGSASVCGADVTEDPLGARARIAFLSSSMGLYQRLTARELIAYFGRLQGLEGDVLAGRVEEMVGLFALEDFSERVCGKLSTGQRQRVSLARALVHDPPVLILDEPTLGLDVLSGHTIHDFIVRERSRGKTILLSTHQMEEVELLADRVGILRKGELVAEGAPAELLRELGAPNLAQAFLALVSDGELVPGETGP